MSTDCFKAAARSIEERNLAKLPPPRPPTFIVGVPRSGTTLVSVILDSHSRVHVPTDSFGPHLVRSWKIVEDSLLADPDLRTRSAAQRVADYWKTSKERFTGFNVRPGENLRRSLQRHFGDMAHRAGKGLWCDKCPEQLTDIPLLKFLFPDARFVHVVRDPRAVAASQFRRQRVAPELAALNWKRAVTKALFDSELLGPKGTHLVRYEDLVAHPRSTIDKVCAFLGVPFEGSMLNLADHDDVTQNGAYVATEFDANRISSWSRHLSSRQVDTIEALTCDLMERFRYTPVSERANPMTIARARAFLWKTMDCLAPLFLSSREEMHQRGLMTRRVPIKTRLKRTSRRLGRLWLSADFLALAQRHRHHDLKPEAPPAPDP